MKSTVALSVRPRSGATTAADRISASCASERWTNPALSNRTCTSIPDGKRSGSIYRRERRPFEITTTAKSSGLRRVSNVSTSRWEDRRADLTSSDARIQSCGDHASLVRPCPEFDLHHFRTSSVFEFNPVTRISCQQRFADRRNPTDGVAFKIEFVDTNDGKRFGRAVFIFYRYRRAERNAVRWPARRIDNVARCQNLL